MEHGDVSADLAKRLKLLRERIDEANIPSSKLDESLNIATWNIREFGKKPRQIEAIHLLAEILNQFDLIAITELRDNLDDLRRVMAILGPYWRVVFCDARDDFAGNDERIGYLYDKRMCAFTGLAAEADPPRARGALSGDPEADYQPLYVWWRSPYMASFVAGNFDFTVLTAHLRWGKSVGEREEALRHLAEWIHRRQTSRYVFDKDIIVVGDFNIPKVGDSLYKAITSKGLEMPPALAAVRFSTVSGQGRYDQILHYSKSGKSFTNNGGILDFYQGDHTGLFPELTKEQFTFQLSDHFPLWIQLDTDIEGIYWDRAIRLAEA
jgi:hypothetical protein